MTRTRLLTIVGVLVSLVALWLAFRGLQWEEFRAALQRANYLYVVPAAALILADYWFRSVRWGCILAPTRRIPTARLFPTLIIGFAANNVIPARVGELWRVWGLARDEGIRKSRGLATLVVERVFDGFTLLFLLALVSLWAPLNGQARLMEWLFLLFFGAVLAGLLLLLFLEPLALRLAGLVLRPLPERMGERALTMIGNFAAGLHSLRSPTLLGAIVGTSVLAWLCEAGGYYVLLHAFRVELDPREMVAAAIFTLCLINLGILLPAAPGYVGTFESFGRLALVGAFAVQEELAMGVVVLSHGLQYALITGLGLFFASRHGLGFFSTRPAKSRWPDEAMAGIE